MLTNFQTNEFDVIEVTNELPVNRLGGVGSVIDNLMSGFDVLDVKVLWYLVDYGYSTTELNYILSRYDNVAVGSTNELKNIKAPVAHLHTYNHNPQLLQALQGKATLFTVHSLLQCEASSNNVDMNWAIKKQEELISGCDHIVLVSEAELKHYYRLGYQHLNRNVSVIHNGLKNPHQTNGNRLTKKLGFCGRMVPRKRPEYVQMILKESGFEEYSSLIAGRGFTHFTRQLLQDRDLASRVQYLGWCGDQRLENFYQSIELLTIPSVYEPFGMVALEAMSRGIPVVCTHIDGLVEVLGDAAIYADSYYYDSFKSAMTCWLNTGSKERQKIIADAKSRYATHFTDLIMASNYREQFLSIH